jgi:hypothetical protein
LRIEGVAWSAQRIPTVVNLGFLDRHEVIESKLNSENACYRSVQNHLSSIELCRGNMPTEEDLFIPWHGSMCPQMKMSMVVVKTTVSVKQSAH